LSLPIQQKKTTQLDLDLSSQKQKEAGSGSTFLLQHRMMSTVLQILPNGK
jgi:hypothetical protein